MDKLTLITAFIAEVTVLMSVIVPIIVSIRKIGNGTKCQLRSEMLRIYYHNREQQLIRQYEFENFMYLYGAYKALRGNSFIDKIHKEVESWEVVS